MQALYGRPVFVVEADTFFWEDVVLDAIRRGKWAQLEQEVREGFAALEEFDSAEDDEFEAAVDEAAQEFRYDRELVTAQEMERWLAAREVNIREWMDHIRRSVARTRTTKGLASLVADHPMDPDQLAAALRVDLVCSGSGEELAAELARRAAAAAASPVTPESPSEAGPLPTRLPPGLSVELAQQRIRLLARIEEGAEQFRKSAITPEAIRREIGHHHTEWIRIDCRAVAFDDEAGAREGALCLKEDGIPLDEVAAAAHATIAESRFYLDDLDPEVRPMFMAARPVDVLGPIFFEGAHTLFRVVDKVMPSENDPEILRRAETGVAARVMSAQAQQRVQWQLPW
ncbi:MAG TPA: hypothetical protein VFU03_00410 [Gemmatimonadales bacterium]|nr:hypothetical protein [Gemmatimonadales bacterium]